MIDYLIQSIHGKEAWFSVLIMNSVNSIFTGETFVDTLVCT